MISSGPKRICLIKGARTSRNCGLKFDLKIFFSCRSLPFISLSTFSLKDSDRFLIIYSPMIMSWSDSWWMYSKYFLALYNNSDLIPLCFKYVVMILMRSLNSSFFLIMSEKIWPMFPTAYANTPHEISIMKITRILSAIVRGTISVTKIFLYDILLLNKIYLHNRL